MHHPFRINRDPNLLPVKVRAYIGGTFMLMLLVVLLSNSGIWHRLAACGLILGVFGSGALYWETIVNDVALQSVSNEIARLSSRRLSFSEVTTLIELSHYGILVFFALLIILLVHFKTGQNDALRTGQGVLVLLAVSVLPVVLSYFIFKMTRFWCSKWFQEFQKSSQLIRAAQTKRLLRKIGFASLFLSGTMQLPATLF